MSEEATPSPTAEAVPPTTPPTTQEAEALVRAMLDAPADGWVAPDRLAPILAQGEAAVAPLLRLLAPEELAARAASEDDWQTYYAACLLCEIGHPAAAPAVTALLARRGDDADDLLETLGDLLPGLGPAAFPHLLRAAQDPAAGWYARATAANAARTLAGGDPGMLEALRGSLRGVLMGYVARAESGGAETFTEEDSDVIGSFVGDLADLQDERARPLIAAAFAADLVDPMFARPKDVEDSYRKPSPPREYRRGEWLGQYAARHAEHLAEQRGDPMPPPPPMKFPAPRPVTSLLPPRRPVAPDAPQPARAPQRPGRNDPCWCGSGKKYKKCHYPTD